MLGIIGKDFLKLEVRMCSQSQTQSVVIGIGNRPNRSSQMVEKSLLLAVLAPKAPTPPAATSKRSTYLTFGLLQTLSCYRFLPATPPHRELSLPALKWQQRTAPKALLLGLPAVSLGMWLQPAIAPPVFPGTTEQPC